jgi:hypothetical protein
MTTSVGLRSLGVRCGRRRRSRHRRRTEKLQTRHDRLLTRISVRHRAHERTTSHTPRPPKFGLAAREAGTRCRWSMRERTGKASSRACHGCKRSDRPADRCVRRPLSEAPDTNARARNRDDCGSLRGGLVCCGRPGRVAHAGNRLGSTGTPGYRSLRSAKQAPRAALDPSHWVASGSRPLQASTRLCGSSHRSNPPPPCSARLAKRETVGWPVREPRGADQTAARHGSPAAGVAGMNATVAE